MDEKSVSQLRYIIFNPILKMPQPYLNYHVCSFKAKMSQFREVQCFIVFMLDLLSKVKNLL